MSEIFNQHKVFSLKEVTMSVQRTIRKRYTSRFWVKAEVNKLNYYKLSGHCYPDLLQKEEGKVVAQMRGTIWNADFLRINRQFLSITGSELHDNISILFQASIQFDSYYGISLQIHDIDPSYSLGELEREKQETIAQLKKEGIFNLNKQLSMPLLPKRLAVISVATSKGYADFIKLLDTRMDGFLIEHHLFSSVLQGDKAASEIRHRLMQIKGLVHHFDVVAIIRGGGGEVGLSAYNDLELARSIAQFPIPVITGIGHATNLTVAEMVAHTNSITPSALADLLLEKFTDFIHVINETAQSLKRLPDTLSREAIQLNYISEKLQSIAKNKLLVGSSRLDELIFRLQTKSLEVLNLHKGLLKRFNNNLAEAVYQQHASERHALERMKWGMEFALKSVMENAKQQINRMDGEVDLLHPDHVLKRGYSITRINNKIITDISQAAEGDTLETSLYGAVLFSKLFSAKKTKTDE